MLGLSKASLGTGTYLFTHNFLRGPDSYFLGVRCVVGRCTSTKAGSFIILQGPVPRRELCIYTKGKK